MRKKRLRVRLTRLWLAMYVMIYCMTFTVSAGASSYYDTFSIFNENGLHMVLNGSYAEAGDQVGGYLIIATNGTSMSNAIAVSKRGNFSTDTNQEYHAENSNGTIYINGSTLDNGTAIYNNETNKNSGGKVISYNQKITNGSVFVKNNDDEDWYTAISKVYEEAETNMTTGGDIPAQSTDSSRNTTAYNNVEYDIGNITKLISGEEGVDQPILTALSDYLPSIVDVENNETMNLWVIGNLSMNEIAIIPVYYNVTEADINTNGTIDFPFFILNEEILETIQQEENQTFPTVNATVSTQNPVTVTFNPNGGTVSETSRKIRKGAAVGTLPVPVRTDYFADGWFTQKDGGTQVNAATTFSENVTLYAHWELIPVTLPEFNIVVVNNIQQVTYGNATTSTLRVNISSTMPSGYNLTYQWYECDDNNKTNSRQIPGAHGATYDVPTTGPAGTTYYYCVISVTRNDNGHVLTVETVETDTIPVTINRAAVTVTASDQTIKKGSSIAAGVNQASLTGAVAGHKLSRITLKQADSGNIEPSGAAIVDASGHEVTGNYDITYQPGSLTESAAVTFEVVGGSWNAGGKDAQTVNLTGPAGTALILPADSIPLAGSNPDDGYEAGNWDTDPASIAEITGDATFTYTYARKEKAKGEYYFTKGMNSRWQKSSGKFLPFEVKNTLYDDPTLEQSEKQTFEQFVEARVDGKGNVGYDYRKGSEQIDLRPSYLETLATGEHKIEAVFKDGSAETVFYVDAAEVKVDSLPQTGDKSKPVLYGILAILSAAGIVWLWRRNSKR